MTSWKILDMINVHDKYFAYHGDIVHYLSVDLYSTEPPEDGLMSVAFCLYLINLAIYFNTSIDYLTGLTDGKMPYKRSIRIDK